MKFGVNQAAAAIVLCAVLSGCATAPVDPYALTTVTAEQALALSGEAFAGGQGEKAMAILNNARKTNPANKDLWLKSAQFHFDSANYAEAIADAQQVVARDAGDQVAQGIIVVSGLRVATAAIAQLVKAESLDGDTKGEATRLARALRESLGEIVLVPTPLAQPQASKPSTPAASATRRSSRSAADKPTEAPKAEPKTQKSEPTCPPGNPFCGL